MSAPMEITEKSHAVEDTINHKNASMEVAHQDPNEATSNPEKQASQRQTLQPVRHLLASTRKIPLICGGLLKALKHFSPRICLKSCITDAGKEEKELCRWPGFEGKTDYCTRMRLINPNKNKYKNPKYFYVVRFVSNVFHFSIHIYANLLMLLLLVTSFLHLLMPMSCLVMALKLVLQIMLQLTILVSYWPIVSLRCLGWMLSMRAMLRKKSCDNG